MSLAEHDVEEEDAGGASKSDETTSKDIMQFPEIFKGLETMLLVKISAVSSVQSNRAHLQKLSPKLKRVSISNR